MKVTKVIIENFKSIKDEISFEIKKIANKSCFILLGINESGKSNILEAISLLNPEQKVDYNIDCNSEAEEEKKKISITYELQIDNYNFYKKQFIKKGLDENLVNTIEITKIERKISINSENVRTDFFHIWIKDAKKEFGKYALNEENNKIEIKTDENVKEDSDGEKNILDKNKLETFLEDEFYDLFNKNVPKIIFWKSSEEKYLINKKIDLNIFKEDLNASVPLKNCFKIAGIEKIKEKIDSVVGQSAKIATLKDLLNEKVTEHINNVWKEHKINIRFEIDNMQLSFLIEEKDNTLPKYELNQRSDGFKHFISILLNLSVENETSQLKNKIILLDEPEVHLHPSGEKYLRDELLEIAKNNFVFFATHSIFMVDKKNLDRHFSIKKEKGITNLYVIEKDNPYKEEVLYEALGTSALEHIENNVLILEGKTDRDIFDLYKRKFKSEVKLQNFSLISADGCGNIPKYTKFFNKKLINGFVLVDSDKEGTIIKSAVIKERNYNKKNVFGINDIVDTKKESTLEDLFSSKYIIDSVLELYKGLWITLNNTQPFLGQIKKQFHSNKKPYRKQENEELKKIFFKKISKLNKEDLRKEQYYIFFEKFKEKLEE